MNDTDKEITKLHEQVSQLYLVVKKLSEYVGWQDISYLNLSIESRPNLKSSSASYRQNHHLSESRLNSTHNGGDSIYLLNQHKDVLADDELVHGSFADNIQHSEAISCEEQVHRLTAQLTAAYYRIASLEDQLLAIRHSMETGENGFYQYQ
jgi:hypothetical protein